ncbi:hypothetical protein L1987_48494 [Smallanthus sonchifolius]|uniref:Uncharacterized protein n=1 Tax=Smallanthus sonchifolius TaxID=185202 RepID=A0ACB9FS49_9ASTR|nr:hypothetical protein L1987_48494 [Smallanthus sonchifolius]
MAMVLIRHAGWHGCWWFVTVRVVGDVERRGSRSRSRLFHEKLAEDDNKGGWALVADSGGGDCGCSMAVMVGEGGARRGSNWFRWYPAYVVKVCRRSKREEMGMGVRRGSLWCLEMTEGGNDVMVVVLGGDREIQINTG